MNQKLFKKLVLLIVIMSGNLFFAQTIKGVVTANGTTLPGVSVFVEGSKNGTSTDANGAFELNNVALKSTLVFSYVGYKNVAVKASATMNGVMVSESLNFEEVVVIDTEHRKRKMLMAPLALLKLLR
ncbi:carboxypeptidase-like regulatory domain-containing protein [Flavobacterium sp.]|uniref:carboxypeptidase-like regulatory domain-containing protein n=1 Tax=Flavobacterium sp. TaxID=239 RepID=UPI0026185ADE|nr:carboxypeptidase-like regulatory domain-containing protein [Flavobacterium sp.]MDG2432382.1 carboxypeptidase-like regulatory domain-containing protein [Flavobacterium sp.]